jgi:hypothetical protein
MDQKPSDDFEAMSAEEGRPSLSREYFEFLRQNKKWWLLPIILVLLVLSLLMLLSATGAAPFIYTLF